MERNKFNYMGHEFKCLGTLKESGITFQEALDDALPQNSLNLNTTTGFNYEEFYSACGDDRSAVFECEGRTYVALRWGLCEIKR